MDKHVICLRCRDWVRNDGSPVSVPQCVLCDGTKLIPTELDTAYRLRIAQGSIFYSRTIKKIRKELGL